MWWNFIRLGTERRRATRFDSGQSATFTLLHSFISRYSPCIHLSFLPPKWLLSVLNSSNLRCYFFIASNFLHSYLPHLVSSATTHFHWLLVISSTSLMACTISQLFLSLPLISFSLLPPWFSSSIYLFPFSTILAPFLLPIITSSYPVRYFDFFSLASALQQPFSCLPASPPS